MANTDRDIFQSTLTRIEHMLGKSKSLVVDGDTHITDLSTVPTRVAKRMTDDPNYFHGKPASAEQLIKRMNAASVDMSLVWQNPATTEYVGDPDRDYESLRVANEYVSKSAANHPTRLIPAGWTDPRTLGVDKAIELVEYCVGTLGFPLVKMNPAQNEFPMDSEPVLTVTDAIITAGAVPAYHFGGDTEYTPASALKSIVERYPDSPIVAVHMGGGGASYVEAESLYHEARLLGLHHPNLHYMFSAKRDTHIESDLITYQHAGLPFRRNLHCASDFPYGLPSWNFGGFRALFKTLENHPEALDDPRLNDQEVVFDEESVADYLGASLVELCLNAYDRIGFTS